MHLSFSLSLLPIFRQQALQFFFRSLLYIQHKHDFLTV
ncbi:hypothetical protein [Escherichia coli IS5]|nr:hypothetical protein AKO63_2607 [Escherichia coli]CDK52817.1 hypothetical protein [Escherichia coli IS5]